MSAATSTPGASAPRTAWGAIILLTVIYTLNFLDRQIVSILAAPIMADLQLTNTQFGLISGLAFAVFYSVLGLPIAALADRFHRVRLLAIGCVLWSGMTALCGSASSFLQMFLFRVGVGVGEAVCVPASHSLIADMTTGRSRTFALAVFALGIPLGTLAGLWIGGTVAQEFGWRMAFLIVGAPGLLLALALVVFVREPVRPPVTAGDRNIVGSASMLLGMKPFRQLSTAAAFAAMGGYGVVSFLGLYLVQYFQLSLAEAGFGLGLAIGVGGAIGTAIGGRAAVWTGSAAGARRLAGVGLILAAFALAGALLAASPAVCIAALGVVAACNALWYGPVFADVQTLSPPRSRAMAAALLNMIVNLVGLGLGPLMVGAVSDFAASANIGVAHDPLRLGLMTMGASNLLAAVFLFLTRTPDTEPTEQRALAS